MVKKFESPESDSERYQYSPHIGRHQAEESLSYSVASNHIRKY